jgi:hypothetical protein
VPKYAPGSVRALRESRKPGPKGTRAHTAKAGATCGAKKRGGGKCQLAPGWGTSHPGIGKCKLHGGSVPNHVRSAAKEEYRRLLGVKREIDPVQAIIECIQIRAGEVEWLSNRMAELDQKHWIEDTMVGKQFHLYARERQAAINDLARYSQMAISLNIAERAVKLAETYGEMIAQLIQGILGDLELNEEQRSKVPGVVRRHLIALDGGRATPAQIEAA